MLRMSRLPIAKIRLHLLTCKRPNATWTLQPGAPWQRNPEYHKNCILLKHCYVPEMVVFHCYFFQFSRNFFQLFPQFLTIVLTFFQETRVSLWEEEDHCDGASMYATQRTFI